MTQETLRHWNVAVGNFVFRYRDGLIPAVFLLSVLAMRPRVILGSPVLTHILLVAGALVALTGECVRLITIGYDYIKRGGKNRQVYASRLVRGGIYAGTRNPMYLGNGLIAVGMTMYTGAPQAYVFLIPFFLFFYQAIIAAEEAYLRNKFGSEYDLYCSTVNRFMPSLNSIRHALSGMPYDWRRAIRKDFGTFTALLIGLFLTPVWRTYFLQGAVAAKETALSVLVTVCIIGILYSALKYLKRHTRFLYSSSEH
ncbi:MAG: methyltransferase family protein [Candidatus Binatia bacterium]